MVEGHSVHRVATLHRKRLIGKIFKAWSPNGRFTEGASLIDGKTFSKIEAVGKNLFAFFGEANDPVVVHVHFGMAGNWAVYDDVKSGNLPGPPTKTNRLRLECAGIVADLTAMTLQHGGMELYNDKRKKLGEDPLRDDADPEKLWTRVQKSNKSIGALIMDQSYFTGPGNIYRCEILFKAGVHPDKAGKDLEKSEFDMVWYHTVALLKRGYETGSILTVDPQEALAFGKPRMRRYIYNTSHCPRCTSPIKTWQINNRTCYACGRCQPLIKSEDTVVVTPQKDCLPFNSHCARESVQERLLETGPSRLTAKEIKAELSKLGAEIPSNAKKGKLVELLSMARETKPSFVSPEAAAAEKAAAGESLAVEHIAELGPSQARIARASRVLKFDENNPSKSTVAQLKQELRNLCVEFPSKATKSVLVDLLQNAADTKRPDGVLSNHGGAKPRAKREAVPKISRESKRIKK
jgi:formamidopyrimidine-DNA glycosylase